LREVNLIRLKLNRFWAYSGYKNTLKIGKITALLLIRVSQVRDLYGLLAKSSELADIFANIRV